MATPDRDRTPRLALGGLAVVGLFFVATRMLGGGGEDPFASLGQGESVPSASAVIAAPPSAVPVATHDHDEPAPAQIRDPFCPLAAPAGPAAACPTITPTAPPGAPAGAPPVLVEIYADGGHDHARLRFGAAVAIAHLGDTVHGYRLIALTKDCAELARDGKQTTVCVNPAQVPGPGR